MEQAFQDMRNCMQTSGITVLQHGDMVLYKYKELEKALQEDALSSLSKWRLPNWLVEHRQLLLNAMVNTKPEVVKTYLRLHDIGKPFCRTVDEEGRQHFPNHAAVSERVMRIIAENHDFGNHQQRSYFDKQDMLWVAELIGQDMDAHLLKQEGVAEFASRSNAPLLLLAALSEIHANAGLFGGIDSTSFKIKFKQLEKMGKRVFEKIAANSAAHKTGIPA